MNVVIISSIPISPCNAGNRARIWKLAAEIITLGHKVDLALLPQDRRPHDIASNQAALDPTGRHRVHGVTNGTRRQAKTYRVKRSLRKLWRKIFRKIGLEEGYYTALDQFWNSNWDSQLAEICRTADVVIVEYAINSHAFACCPSQARKVLDMHDILANRHRLFAERGLGRGYWVSLKPRDEMRAFQRADALIAIQDEEASQVRRLLDREAGTTLEVTVVSHLPAVADTPLDTSRGHAAHFLGSDNPPNRLSINHFIDATLPIILREDPNFELFVIGSVSKSVPDHPNVVKMGFVDDPADAFRRAPLAINPMKLGTGVNIKLLDAMAVGAPVVATSQGARGVPQEMLAGVVVVNDMDNAAFAHEVLSLTADSERRARLGRLGHEAARDLAARHRRALAEVLDPDRSKSSPTETKATQKIELPA